MKKMFLKKATAFILSVVLIIVCFSASVSFMAAPKTFTGFAPDAGTVVDNADGSHLITFNHGYSGVTSSYKIDLTKGFKWNFVNAQFGVHFSFKKSAEVEAASFNFTHLLATGESAKELLFYPAGGYVGIASRNGFMGYNSNAGSSDTAVLEMKFKKETLEGADYYRLYINDEANFICFPEATFNDLNNYNSTTGKFNGAHLGISIENTPLSIAVAPLEEVVPTDVPFVATMDGGIWYEENGDKAPYAISVGGWKAALSTFKTDLTDGLTFNISDLMRNPTQYAAIGISGDFFATPIYPIVEDYLWSLQMWLYDGDKIMVNVPFGNQMQTGLSAKDTHTLSFKLEDGVYQAYLDDVKLTCGGMTLPKYTFEEYNNSNAGEGKVGAYIQLGTDVGVTFRNIASASWVAAHKGDVNNDGNINDADDFTEMKKALLGYATENFTSLLADVNGDNAVNNLDFIGMKNLTA